MSAYLYIGIDPGVSGAVAALWDTGHEEVSDAPTLVRFVGRAKRRTIDPHATISKLRVLLHRFSGTVAWAAIEHVTPQPSFGARANHVLGRSAATWETALVSLGIRYELVRPAEWKRGVGLPTKATKDDSIALARQHFPAQASKLIKSKDGRAEALLIAEWLRRQKERLPE